jgi:S1-C subfamily serine protease
MGIGVSEVNEFVASLYSLAVNEGVLITNIVTGSPAEKSGLKEGDVITMMNDTNIVSTRDLAEELYTSKIGEKISVTYWRSNVKQTTELTLTEMPPAQ